jgi:LysM repeat protein
MNNANPLIPQGSLLEQKTKSKPHLRIAIFIVAVHVVFLGGLLIQGCKPEGQTPSLTQTPTNETGLPPLDTLYGTNAPAPTGGLADLGTVAPIISPNVTPAPYVTPPAPAPTAQEHIVARGDSFYSIGKKFGVSANAIAKANPGVDSSHLKIGQKLQIPAPTTAPAPLGLETPAGAATETYTVKSADTLTKIAREHGTTVTALKQLNGLTVDRINLGQKLKLPAKSAPVEPAAPVVPLTPPPVTNVGTPHPLTSTPIAR